MILVVDTSTLLDLESVNGLPLLPKLARSVHVLDVVLNECGAELTEEIRAAGYREVAVPRSWVMPALGLRTANLSSTDALVLYYAKKNKAILVASDGPLRKRAARHGVEVHGAIWVAQRALDEVLIEPNELCAWLEGWLASGRRLPQDEIDRLRELMKCK
ncbi:hypothetical protein [Oceanithermus desulfurans]|uniref:PIN domain-containing protein n=2 Tax=Oceanithermus desulfurans TaxID=227924 RepID=A0A511RK77_9DEIN|nr:hypothetical protein [Oceanithermus desulfurans]MBB6030540.1 putative nucleic acid-binding protein [Oceanithermus desulfurans]GEM90050.1 hypothetical protein ODE01S_14840 [Oceanithermus desulfurans NBRC 100063]